MNVIKRNFCCINNNLLLENVETIKNFPVYMGVTSQSLKDDLFCDMSISINRTSGVLQLNNLIPLEVLYANSHRSGVTGKIWREHHERFARFILKYKPKSVLEIGGGHGKLANIYKKYEKIQWTIVEPNLEGIRNDEINYIEGFFDTNFLYDKNYDTVVHSHVFEHIYDPILFLSYFTAKLKEGNRHIFSVPNMRKMLENKYSNCLNFEHTVLLTENLIEIILKNAGFYLLEKEYFLEDHSIFYSYVRKNNISKNNLTYDNYDDNIMLYNKYTSSLKERVQAINNIINKFDGLIYIFGAHIFSQVLLAYGLNNMLITGVLDNDLNKSGKRLYGTKFQVIHPSEINYCNSICVILNTGVYSNEIKYDLLTNYSSNIIFI
jgi:2-polyprenyl-3-methyl-5-hydroxy-6-metoxy-1,4-benzoquinol methylase